MIDFHRGQFDTAHRRAVYGTFRLTDHRHLRAVCFDLVTDPDDGA